MSGASANRIDSVEPGAMAPRLHDEGPEMHAGRENVCAPGNDEFRVTELFGFGPVLETESMREARAACGGADGPVETRCAQAMEKTAVHAGTVQESHGSCVAVRQDGFGTVFGGDRRQPLRDGVERFIPGNSFELASAFGTDASLGVEQTVGRILALQVTRNLATQESARGRILWIAAQLTALAG